MLWLQNDRWLGDPMPEPQAPDTSRKFEPQSQANDQDRRSSARTGTVLSRIEDATYAILRKHEQQRA